MKTPSHLLEKMKNSGFLAASRFVFSYWRQLPFVMGFLVFTKALMVGCDVLLPYFAGRLVDAVAIDVGSSGPSEAQSSAAIWALVGVLTMEASFYTLRFFQDRVWVWLAPEVMSRIVNDVFRRVQRFSTDWHANNFAGATVRKITRGKWAYDGYADSMFFGLIPTVLIVIGMSVMFYVQWAVMGLMLFFFIVGLILVNVLLVTKYIAPANIRFNKNDTKLGAILADSITCNSVVKAFGAEAREEATVADQTEKWRATALRSWNRQVNSGTIHSGILVLMFGSLLGLALVLWSRGLTTPGQLAQVVASYFIINGYLRHIGMHMREMQKAVNEMEDAIDFMHRPMDMPDKQNAITFKPVAGAISFEEVTFHYKKALAPLYQDFSLDIRPGEKVALVGHSGSGKSTLVKLVQRLYDVEAGRIVIDGQDISEVTQSSLRANIALVPQEPILFHRTLRENIAYGYPEATDAEIMEAAKRAHAHEFIKDLEAGYDTLVGERGIKLSGGERQRVALARAFLADCPILILDEATSSLDSHTESYIQESITALMEGRTTIVIAHRLSTIRAVDRILVFDKGRIIEEGTHDELMARPGSHYASLVAVQMLESKVPEITQDLAS
ncbi:MAG: ABC transporter ATP-binding protein [Alphaproteobacteria bacterium]|nr:MAG: ABC transporter ATP-binding protein [Alphaproteobacteria bacterium]